MSRSDRDMWAQVGTGRLGNRPIVDGLTGERTGGEFPEAGATGAPLRIAHLGSLHCGDIRYDDDLLTATVRRVNEVGPDLVLVAGDLTAAGYEWEYATAVSRLAALEAPMIVVPGNHDSRNVGYVHFEREVGPRFLKYRRGLPPGRGARLGMPGVTVLAVDSSEPDLDAGRIGREWYPWIREQFTPDTAPDGAADLKVFMLHHHVVSIPGSGREASVVQDAGDLLAVLTELGVDLVVSGHKHVPFFWGLNGMLVANCGTASTHALRGTVPPSWNEIVVDAATTKVFLHYSDGRRELAVVRSRTTQDLVREAFHITPAFFASNHLPVD